MNHLVDLAASVVRKAQHLGAEQASVSVSLGSHTMLTRRDSKVEQVTEATTHGLALSLMVDERYSVHSTSDMRPQAMEAFLTRAIAATRYLEPDPARRQPDIAQCGRGISQTDLELLDPSWQTFSPEDRSHRSEALDDAFEAIRQDDVISNATWSADGHEQSARVMSNGFSDSNEGAWFTMGGSSTLAGKDGKRPEGHAFYGARFQADLPAVEAIAQEADRRVRQHLGAQPIQSGCYPMILLNRCAGRLLGTLAGPLNGASLYEGRSCLDGKLNRSIGSEQLTILDDPLIPRGMGSRPWDGDAITARPMTIIDKGVLRSYYINTYYGRKLETPSTSGSRSNWVIPHTDSSWQDIVKGEKKAILVTGFLGGNTNSITGDFSYGIRGMLVENGVQTSPLSEMNISGNVLTIFNRLSHVANDPWHWSSVRSPSLVFDSVQFSGV